MKKGLFLLLTLTIFSLICCDNMTIPEFLAEYGGSAAIERYVFSSTTYTASGGKLCIPSETTTSLIFEIRNPNNYDLTLQTNVTDTLGAPLAGLSTSVIKHNFQKYQVNIVPDVSLEHTNMVLTATLIRTDGMRNYESKTIHLRCDSPPSSASSVFKAVSGGTDSTVAFTLPDITGKNADIEKIEFVVHNSYTNALVSSTTIPYNDGQILSSISGFAPIGFTPALNTRYYTINSLSNYGTYTTAHNFTITLIDSEGLRSDVLCPDPVSTAPVVGSIEYSGTEPIGVVFWTGGGVKRKVVALEDTGLKKWQDSNSWFTYDSVDDYGFTNQQSVKAWDDNFTDHPAFYSCENWDPISRIVGVTPGPWYLPAINELQTLSTVLLTINPVLESLNAYEAEKIKTVTEPSCIYWSSSGPVSHAYNNWPWIFSTNSPGYANRDAEFNVRPIITLGM